MGGGVQTPRYKKGNGITKFSELPWFDPEADSGLLNSSLNSEVWITESGTWVSPITGWVEVTIISGGEGGYLFAPSQSSGKRAYSLGGRSGAYDRIFLYLVKGQEIPVVIGAGGVKSIEATYNGARTIMGGNTSFDGHVPRHNTTFAGTYDNEPDDSHREIRTKGGGYGGSENGQAPTFYGGGGSAYHYHTLAAGVANSVRASDGGQGVVRVCWSDPDKAAGPLPGPVLLSARNVATHAAASATVNLYDPETGQGSVWREEDALAKLAEGYITEEAWLAILEEKAAKDFEAWVNNPETEEERFQLLQQACAAKLTETDKYTQPDYPIDAETRQLVYEYREAIRGLNHLPGAPWDGGGKLTPWPTKPAIKKTTNQ